MDKAIPHCSAIRQSANCVTLYFNSEKAARDFFNSHYAGLARPTLPNTPAVARHHVERGCCDGTDPAGCWRRREEEQRQREAEQREARRIERERARSNRPADEYAGTEPSENATLFNSFYGHDSPCRHEGVPLRMGERCSKCGLVF